MSRVDAEITTRLADTPLEILLDPRVGRVVPPSLVGLAAPQTLRKVNFPAGSYYQVWEDGVEVWPWTQTTGNAWLRGQLKEMGGGCVCGFAFKKGGREGTLFKKPSVCRDHISVCTSTLAGAPSNPLVELCVFSRESEKTMKAAREASKALKRSDTS